MMKFALIFALICTGAFAQLPSLGKCPDLKVVQNFDVEKYLGTWYEFGRYFVFTELGGQCTTAEYSLNEDGTVNVLNKQFNTITGKNVSIEGTAELVGENGEGELSVTFPSPLGTIKGSLSILATDYSNFTVAFSCQEFQGLFNTKQAWILTRDRIPNEDVVLEAYKTFEESGFDRTFFTVTNQQDC